MCSVAQVSFHASRGRAGQHSGESSKRLPIDWLIIVSAFRNWGFNFSCTRYSTGLINAGVERPALSTTERTTPPIQILNLIRLHLRELLVLLFGPLHPPCLEFC